MGNALSELSRLYEFEGPEMKGGLSWQIRNATKNNQKFTLFYSQQPPTNPIALLLKKEVSMLLKLRHPNILHVQQPPTNILGFTAELIKVPLFMAKTLSPVERLNGLQQLSTAIQFLHDNAKLIHNCINPWNIYITPSGQWKVAGFYYAAYMQYSADQIQTQEFNVMNDNMHIEYCSPEFVLNQQVAIENDYFSFGMILAFLNDYPPTPSDGNLLSYKHFNNNLISWYPKLPTNIQHLVQQTTNAQMIRQSHLMVIKDTLFTDNVALQCLNTFDSIDGISLIEKAKFFKALQNEAILSQFPTDVIINKCFPILVNQIKDPQLSVFIIPVIFNILDKYGHANDIELLLPSFTSICTPVYPASARIGFLKHFLVLGKSARPYFYKQNLIPLLFSCLECNEEETNAHVFQLLLNLDLVKLIDYTVLKRLVLKKANFYLTQPQSRDFFIKLVLLLIVNKIIDERLIQEMLGFIFAIKDAPVPICNLFVELVGNVPYGWYTESILPNMIQQVYYCTDQLDLETCFKYFTDCNEKIKNERKRKLPANKPQIANQNIPQVAASTPPLSAASVTPTFVANKQPSSLNMLSTKSSLSPIPITNSKPNSSINLFNTPVNNNTPVKKEEFSVFASAPQEANPFQEEQSFGAFQTVLKDKLEQKSNTDYKAFDPFK